MNAFFSSRKDKTAMQPRLKLDWWMVWSVAHTASFPSKYTYTIESMVCCLDLPIRGGEEFLMNNKVN